VAPWARFITLIDPLAGDGEVIRIPTLGVRTCLVLRNRKKIRKTRAAVVEPLETRRLLSTSIAYFEDISTTPTGPASATWSGGTITPYGGLDVTNTTGTAEISGLPAHTMINVQFVINLALDADGNALTISVGDRTQAQTWNPELGWQLEGSANVGGWIAHSGDGLTVSLGSDNFHNGGYVVILSLTVSVYNPTLSVSGGGTIAENAMTPTTVTVSRDLPTNYGSSGYDDAIPDTTVTVGGTATNGTDFTASPSLGSTVTLTGQSNKQFDITPKKDNLVEGAETLTFSSGATAVGTLSISDDPPVVSIAATDANAAEPATSGGTADTGTMTVTRTGGDTTTPISVSISVDGTASTSDYTITNTTTISVGTSATITVTPSYDTDDVETDESVVATTQPGGAVYLLAPATTKAAVVIAGRNGFTDKGNVGSNEIFWVTGTADGGGQNAQGLNPGSVQKEVKPQIETGMDNGVAWAQVKAATGQLIVDRGYIGIQAGDQGEGAAGSTYAGKRVHITQACADGLNRHEAGHVHASSVLYNKTAGLAAGMATHYRANKLYGAVGATEAQVKGVRSTNHTFAPMI
jgi:hypothetical protein